MDQSPLGPLVRRPRTARAVALVLLVTVVVIASGCGARRRQSMRPVYLAPTPISTGVSADCPTTITPSSEPAVITTPASPPTTVEPGLEPASLPAEAPASASPGPLVPRLDSPPPVTAPSASPDEPGLEPIPLDKDSKVTPSKPDQGKTPGTSLRDSAYGTAKSRRTAPAPTTGRVRSASLSEQVRPYVNDPGSLFAPPKADRPWKYIVLHHSASKTGGYASIDAEHRKRLGWNGCGYHFVIGNGSESADGQIEVAQRWSNQKLGVHCRDGKNPDVNEYGIGICLVGDLEDTPPTEKQVAAARALVAYLGQRYNIPADRTETHAHLAASPTACPGRLFPAQSILSRNGLALRDADALTER